MTIFQFKPSDTATLKNEISVYRSSVVAPLDGMWEAFTSMADHYAILADGRMVGYCAVNPEAQLMQFHVSAAVDAESTYAQAVKELSLRGAITATCETKSLALAMDHQTSVSVKAIMYRLSDNPQTGEAVFPDGAHFARLDARELEDAVTFAADTLGASRDWLTGYFEELITRKELFGLRLDGGLIATGECRISDTQPGIADVGMIVDQKERGKGIATNVLRSLVAAADAIKMRPICSTEPDNIAARKAIGRAGFASYHRILDVSF